MGRKIIDLTGRRFGRLIVVGRAGIDRFEQIMWTCKCDCGKVHITAGKYLITGRTHSCGCLRKEISSINGKNRVFVKQENIMNYSKLCQ